MKHKINYLAIITFYVIAVALRYMTNKAHVGSGVSNELIKVLVQGMGPAIGAAVVFLVFKIRPALTLKGNYKKIWSPLLLYWVLPVVLLLLAEYAMKGTIRSFAAITAVLLYGLLEEIGWRGFLQKELKPLPEWANILIVATLWLLWHLNVDMTSANVIFGGILVLGSWGIGKVADHTQSLLAVSAFHSLNNFFPELNTVKTVLLLVLLAVWISALVIRKRQGRERIR